MWTPRHARLLWGRRRIGGAILVVNCVLVLAGATRLATTTSTTREMRTATSACYFCAMEVCSQDLSEHWDADGQLFSKATHDACTTEACEHNYDCSPSLHAPTPKEVTAAVADESGMKLMRLVRAYPAAARVNVERSALQVIGCQGTIEEHHTLSPRQLAALDRAATTRALGLR